VSGDSMTVCGWLSQWAENPEGASEALLSWAASAARSRGARGLSDDLAQEAAIRVIRDGARLMRAAPPEASAAAYVHGVVRRIAQEWRRLNAGLALREAGILDQSDSVPVPARSARGCLADLELARMTERQRVAFNLLLAGRRKADAARDLGIRRQTLNERLIRGGRRALREDIAPLRDRAWAAQLGAAGSPGLRPTTRGVLALHGSGLSLSEIGTTLHMTRNAVRCRLRRAWQRWERLHP